MSVELVIFDCDGTLIDSEHIVSRIHAEALTELGYPITQREVVDLFTGLAGPEISQRVIARWGRDLPADYYDRTQPRMDAAFAAELKPVAGIAALLEAIHLQICVASNTRAARLRAVLAATGLLPHFEPHLFSASMVEHPKPAPDMFLLAARTLRVDPDRCLVIEDTPTGIHAARAAGMTVLGFTAGRHCHDGYADRLIAAGATAVVARADQILQYL